METINLTCGRLRFEPIFERAGLYCEVRQLRVAARWRNRSTDQVLLLGNKLFRMRGKGIEICSRRVNARPFAVPRCSSTSRRQKQLPELLFDGVRARRPNSQKAYLPRRQAGVEHLLKVAGIPPIQIQP